MKWLIGIGLVIVGCALCAVAVAWLVGRSLPAEHEASVTREIVSPLSLVASRVRDVATQPDWRPGVTRIEVRRRIGAVLHYVEHGPNGAIPFAFAEITPDRTFTSTIDTERLPFGGTWTIALSPVSEQQTRVTITERGVVRSAVFRALARHVFGHTRTIEQYLSALEKSLVKH
jgi:hypothetical protein